MAASYSSTPETGSSDFAALLQNTSQTSSSTSVNGSSSSTAAAAAAAASSMTIQSAQTRLQQLINGPFDDEETSDTSHTAEHVSGTTSSQVTSDAGPRRADGQQTHSDFQSHQPPQQPNSQESPQFLVTSIYQYTGEDDNYLSFGKGDFITVIRMESTGWWDGQLVVSQTYPKGSRGWFPSNYVRRVVSDRRPTLTSLATSPTSSRMVNKHSTSNHTPDSTETTATTRNSIPFDSHLDLLLGRRGNGTGSSDIDRVLRFGSSDRDARFEDEEDLTSFSTGGDIFAEIAAAAAVGSTSKAGYSASSKSESGIGSDVDGGTRQRTEVTTEKALLPAPRITEKSVASKDTTNANSRLIDIDSDWLPKVDTDGRVLYYNTRTGETSSTLPSPSSSVSIVSRKTEGTVEYGRESTTSTFATSTRSVDTASPSKSAPTPSVTDVFTNAQEILSTKLAGTDIGGASSQSMLRMDSEEDGPEPSSSYSGASTGLLPSGAQSARESNTVTLTPRRMGSGTIATVTNRSPMTLAARRKEAHKQNPSVSSARHLATIQKLTDRAPAPSLGYLSQKCAEALTSLSEAISRRPSPESAAIEALEDQDELARKYVEEAAAGVNLAVQNLLAAADVPSDLSSSQRNSMQPVTVKASPKDSLPSTLGLAASSTSASRPSSVQITAILPPLTSLEFRSLAMKVAATESKLMLSIRTAWCLLSSSQSEEKTMALNKQLDNLTTDDALAQAKRAATLTMLRRENELKLKRDVALQIRTLGKALDDFVGRMESFAIEQGIALPLDSILLPQRSESEFSSTALAFLAPFAQPSGAVLGHGFGKRYCKDRHRPVCLTPSSYQFPKSPREPVPCAEPSRILSALVIADLEIERLALLEDISGLRTMVDTLLTTQLSQNILKPAYIPTFTAQATQLLHNLSTFLTNVEDVDIASKVDIHLSPEIFAALVCQSIHAPPITGIFSQMEAADSEYQATLHQATKCLSKLLTQKDALHQFSSAFLITVQSLTAVFALSVETGRSPSLPSPSQPSDCSPLSYVPDKGVLRMSEATPVLELLQHLELSCDALLGTLRSLVVLSEKHEAMPSEARRASSALRQQLSEPPALTPPASTLSSASSNTLARTKRTSSSAGLGLEDEFAEELESRRDDASFGGNGSYMFPSSARNSNDRITLASMPLMRKNSTQDSMHRPYLWSRPSRSNSLAESLGSEHSLSSNLAKRDASEDLRLAMQEAGLSSTGSPTNQSPSKSKLKQFFGADAPAIPVHRPPRPVGRESTPFYLQPDYPHDQISYASDGSIRAGTLHALVCRLTNHMSADTNFNNAFLMTYQTFTDSYELLERLKARYRIEPPQDMNQEEYVMWSEQKQKLIRIRVENVLRSWITDYLYDDDEGQILGRFAAFAVTLPPESQLQLTRLIERRRATGVPRRLTASVASGSAPAPIIPRNLKKIKFLELDPVEIARQFTIMDSRLFLKITPEECLSKAWPKKFNKDMPNFRAVTDMSNSVTGWVAIAICTQNDARRRAATVKHFIAIAEKCRQLSNFTTLMQILAGLNCGAIHRLRRTWELVNHKSMATLSYLGNLMSPENNHAMYRDALRLVGSPCVPFLGVYFTDWVMSGEANSDMLRDKPDQINFAKRARVVESIQQIQLQQATPYNFKEVKAIQDWIEDELSTAKRLAQSVSSRAGEPDLMATAYDLSLAIEPREREDERSE